ncbi:YccS family putative transporter [Luteibacter sp.]|uniref:YccS family putative transporter n=1 Tax=Luteibacter sp. TaxID=1886636 RepID=UPI0025BFD5F2|nr:YccS family putative transporter [Luteibacter sp.]
MRPFRQLAESDRFADVARVFLALAGIAAWCTLRGPVVAIVPSMLGAIACALSETDDAWRGRLRGLVVTLVCFALAASAVKAAIGTPLLFAPMLALGTFLLVMLGAASGRYATIATGTLILSVYTMIASDAPGGSGPQGTWAIIAGAAWYGALSLAWSALAPQRAVRHALARVFEALAAQMDAKAALFEPVRDLDRQSLDIAFSRANLRTVDALASARAALLDRIGRRQPRGRIASRLGMFFVAQDIHERISSSHYPYDELAAALYHSDLMFRFGRLIRRQAQGCRERADAIRRTASLGSLALPTTALDDVREAMAYRQANGRPDQAVDDALAALLRNVEELHVAIQADGVLREGSDMALQGDDPPSVREALGRIRLRLNRRSMHFRHAIRLSVGMLAGYLLMLALHPSHGYWILLTTLFVCQPSYGGTRRRLIQRVLGTTAGLVLGWAMLRLLPGGDWRLPVLVASGAAFFAFRLRRYALATGVITLFVLLCFDRVGAGYDAIGPRLLDTMLGVCVAATAIRFVLPDWRVRRLDDVVADALLAYGRYLERIVAQYATGKHDDLAYRVARRDAHAAQAAVAGNVVELLGEPGHPHERGERALRLLTALQAGLSHLSTLGTHRQVLRATDAVALADLARHLTHGFDALAEHVRAGTPATPLDMPGLSIDTHADETLRVLDRQCLLLALVHDRIAALPPA